MFVNPRPGELVHLASLQNYKQTGQDDHGQPVGQWQEMCKLYVKREALSGRNVEYARQMFATATHNIYARYSPHVNRNSRFVIGDAIYAVGFVDTLGLKWHRCTCQESWPQGDGT